MTFAAFGCKRSAREPAKPLCKALDLWSNSLGPAEFPPGSPLNVLFGFRLDINGALA